MAERKVLAIDLGAESGRVIQIGFKKDRLHLVELHRFLNTPTQLEDTLCWDVASLWREIQSGIKTAQHVESLGIDTWGVDFALLDRKGQLLANPTHYRDSSSTGMMEWVFERVPRKTLYERTGIQLMAFNGLYRLARLAKDQSSLLDSAETFLTIADLFNYWLCGSKTCEFTLTTTQQVYNPIAQDWDYLSLEALGVPTHIFPKVVQPGTQLGEYQGIPVVLPACHDTASAVVAVPAKTKNFAYLSSGTWSLLGLELDHLVINDRAYESNLTNEGGYEGTNRFLKNIAGMWFLQQCRLTWASQGSDYGYGELTKMVESSTPFQAFIDPDHPDFVSSGDMPKRVWDFCRRTGQSVPENKGDILTVIFESLALKYRYCLDLLITTSGQKVEVLHIVGGGSQNDLLNQMTANAVQRPVVAGPVEATALGNALVQLIQLGYIKDMAEARRILASSADFKRFEPKSVPVWENRFQQFKEKLFQWE
jgi:rhamnulokinase